MTTCYWCGAKDTLTDIGKELDDGKYKMVQCQKCKNAYYVVNKEKVNKPKPLTNEEYIRSCSTEELAEFLWEIVSDYILWDKMHEPQYGGNPKQAFIDWLKEKYNG